MLLGELGGYSSGSPHRLSVARVRRARCPRTCCAWAAPGRSTRTRARGRREAGARPRRGARGSARRRGAAARAGARVWVTEAGAGAPEPGRPRSGSPAEERAGCLRARRAGRRLARGSARRRAILQYTFREDPAYPVGPERGPRRLERLRHVARVPRCGRRRAAPHRGRSRPATADSRSRQARPSSASRLTWGRGSGSPRARVGRRGAAVSAGRRARRRPAGLRSVWPASQRNPAFAGAPDG